jgi:hypothetical protein
MLQSFFVSQGCVKGYWLEVAHSTIMADLYPQWHQVDWQDTYFVLHMPAIGHYDNVIIPSQAKKILLSCHTEPIDIVWLRAFALSRPDCQICVLFDGLHAPASEFYPPNVMLVPWLSWHFQLRRMFEAFGHRTEIPQPKLWASSLCNRSAQFKLYVTAYCILKGYTDRMLISYHALVDKPSDVDHMRTGHSLLEHLTDIIEHQSVLLIDNTARSDRDMPNPSNRDWCFPQHTDCLFNFTNEGFHYSLKLFDDISVVWPGPDLSEKTFKALLAGQALLPVGQHRSISALQHLGFRFDYGIDFSFDQIPGDIDRILGVLDAIDHVMNTPLAQLHDQTIDSRQHNVEWAVSMDFSKRCRAQNERSLQQICQWLAI